MGLLLEAVDVAGPLRWRWLLSDEQAGNGLDDIDTAIAREMLARREQER